jgi:hypothetical protein
MAESNHLSQGNSRGGGAGSDDPRKPRRLLLEVSDDFSDRHAGVV